MHSRFPTRTVCTAVIAALLGAATAAAAQEGGTVRGRIVAAGSRLPISDVQVVVAGTRLGAVTDKTGEYTITSVPLGQHDIRARLIGYKPLDKQVTVTAGAPVSADFELSPAAIQLNQIVVTGTPGGAEARQLGNASTKLDVADLTEKSNLSTVSDVLQSKTPGLTLMPASGTVGAAASIRIRGAGSIITSGSPIIYLDGVRVNTDSRGNYNPSGSGTGGVFAQGTSVLDEINPADIESIEVIKGPAAATLYGSDASAGVIQIITKKGTRGQQKLRWTGSVDYGKSDWAVERPTNYTLCDSVKISPAQAGTWPGCQGQALNTVLTGNPLRDDPVALRDGTLQRYSLSLRGGGDRYSYYISGKVDNQDGIFFNNFSKQKGGRANFNFAPSDKFNFGLNMGYMQSHLRLPLNDDAASGLIISAVRGQPGHSYTDKPGWSLLGPEMANLYDNQSRDEHLTLGSTVNYEPFAWFRNRLTVGLDYTSGLATIYYAPDPTGLRDIQDGFTAQRTPLTHLYTLDYAATLTRELTPSLTAATSFGAQANAYQYRLTSGEGSGLGSPVISTIGSAAITSAASGYTDQNQLGFFVQEQLGWENRLFVTGALRMDRNSAFGTKTDDALYPKFMASYVLSEEPALAGLISALRLDQLRVRGAWGQAGKAPGPFDASRTYIVSVVTLGDGSTGNALRTGSPGNPDLKPERGQEYELGLDASFLGNRLGLEATYYNKLTKDALVGVPVPASSGFSGTRLTNLGEVSNSGIELALNATPVQMPNFSWDTRLNFSTNHNELVRFGYDRSSIPFGIYKSGIQQHAEGYPLAGYWAQPPVYGADGRPQLTGTGAVMIDTVRYIGPSTPTREAGFSNTFTLFKNFRLYALADYMGGHYLFNVKEWVRSNRFQNTEILSDPNLDPLRRAVLTAAGVTEQWVQPADFIKLRDLSLSYSLPGSLTDRMGIGEARLTLAGHNLAILWTRYGGIDPEVNFYGRQSFERADSYTTPMTRTVSLSLNISY